jgi:type I restriction enzyme, S subunit
MTSQRDVAEPQWDLTPLGRVAQLERGKFSARPRNDPKYYGGMIPFVQTGDVRNSRGRISSYSQTLNDRGLKVSKLFPAGTLFITIAANIGDLGISEFACACPDSLVAVRPRSGISQQWLYFALSASKPLLESMATQNAQANLNLAKLNAFPLSVPSRPEQVAVADVLTDAESLVRGLEALIAKKRAVKQGLMQELLAGRTRLPGFDKPWAEQQIKEIAFITKGEQLGRSEMDAAGHIPVWNGGVEPSGYTSKANVRRPVVTISEGGNSCGWVGRPDGDIWLGGHCYALDLRGDRLTIGFLYHRLKSVEPQIMGLRVGSGLPNIQKKRLAEFSVSVPADPTEAAALAAVLDDADSEIRLLRCQLAKAFCVKSAMTQELLTGRIRLPLTESLT